MPFAGTGSTPKREHGTCFFFIITMEFVQKEFDTVKKYEQDEMCVNEISCIWNSYRDHESSQEEHIANSSCNNATILAEMAPSLSKMPWYKGIMY